MAKDPAMLWYWNDWQGGTVAFTRHLKGCYIDLLHAQFNLGHLSLEDIRTILGNDFAAWQGSLSKKFAVDETGKYFNVRLDEEKNKRKSFCESRRKSRNSLTPTHTSSHTSSHTSQRMEDVNEDVNNLKDKTIEEGGKPCWEMVLQNEWKIPFTKIPAEMLRNVIDGAKKHGNAKTLDAIQKTGGIKNPNINYFLKVLEGGNGKRDPAMVRKPNRCLDCKREIPDSQGVICPECIEKRRIADEKEYALKESSPEEARKLITESLEKK
jgi:hypothetical protein